MFAASGMSDTENMLRMLCTLHLLLMLCMEYYIWRTRYVCDGQNVRNEEYAMYLASGMSGTSSTPAFVILLMCIGPWHLRVINNQPFICLWPASVVVCGSHTCDML
jgi:hypothetical protein